MKDAFGRTIDYMRISVTDRCNLRCRYCMPDGAKLLPMGELLTYEEITEVCRIAAGLGITRIRLTGGEPLVRRGIGSLVGMIKAVTGIRQVAMTTNGILLGEKLPKLLENGLDAVNVSLDTLNASEFKEITGTDALPAVLNSLELAEKSGIPVRINTVNRRDLSEETIFGLMEHIRERKTDLRFIELMPIGAGRSERPRANAELMEFLTAHYGRPRQDPEPHGNGPAVYYRFEGFAGAVGMISAMHGKFCGGCNRIRMNSVGQIKSCLCYEAKVDLRAPLRAGDPDQVRELLKKAIYEKPKEHCFEKPGEITESQKMVSIGG